MVREFKVGDEVDCDDGVVILKSAIITGRLASCAFVIGSDIFLASELTLIRTARRSAQATAEEAINKAMEK
jgi:hypothetical protein